MILNYIASYLEKGVSFKKLGKYEEAIKSYDLAIKYKSDYAESYLEKGIVLVNLGKHKEAKENFNLALKYKPNLIEEYEAIIKALRKLGNDLMADEFEEKLKIMQDNL
ncbi:tetratricopeptide repeat family protein [Rickettsia hoogstraalii str. RCCE3]|nr:tetratricopeptide repeat family protein [Rickettsia hoogstraalii str. RCCE3]